MKYKAGDEVRIRADLKEGDGEQYKATVVSEMMRYVGKVTTIRRAYDNGCYTLDIDGGYWMWMDNMFEDAEKEIDVEENTSRPRNVDIGYYLEYCGHRVIKNVYYGGYAHDHNHIFCTTDDSLNQYTLPIDSIEWIIPHED